MDEAKYKIIQELMDELQEDMEFSPDELSERLGRGPKKGVEIVKIEGGPMKMEDEEYEKDPLLEKEEEKLGMDLDEDMEEGEDPMHQAKVMGGRMGYDDDEDMSQEDMLKKRLMKLRG